MAVTDMPTVAIYNDKSSGEKDEDVAGIVAALQMQVGRDFAPIWRTTADLVFVPSTAKPPAKDWTIAVLANSDQAGALGYHDLTPAGQPLGKVFAATDRQYGEHLSVTLSHELLEMLGDPWINLAAQAADGKFYAWETCDACEADVLGYEVGGVLVSDFVTPHWFGNGAGPMDFRQHLTRPLQLASGGYIGVFDPSSGKGWSQVQAEHAQGAMAPPTMPVDDPLYAAHAIPRVGSRRERRFRGSDLWITSVYDTE